MTQKQQKPPAILLDTFLFDNVEAAKAIKQDKKTLHALKVAAHGINARKLSDKPYICKICGKSLEWVITESATHGKIAVMPTDCEPCRLKTHFFPTD